MSDFNQQSFVGGMNMLSHDTRLAPNQYRVLLNARNRYDTLDPVRSSEVDASAPKGLKQELVTFAEYLVLFVAGKAYYRRYNQQGWQEVVGFSMSPTAPRYWTAAVPVATTLYGRFADVATVNSTPNIPAINKPIISSQNISAAFSGNLPGLLVQDNINQPQFIYINSSGFPVARTTQKFSDWDAEYDGDFQLVVDKREYVPIGNVMAWVDNVLYIASQDGNTIYRSVSGRPLDFMINVDIDGKAGGDATTTSYSVGVGNITCLRGLNDGSLFVAAGNANFAVAKNTTQESPKIFGEYTFIRRYLFEATCLSDRSIIDTLGDTRFIDLTGIRSFNAIQQLQNEGRNTVFTSMVAAGFKDLVQDVAAAILYDNYELYAMNTIFGPAIAVYDTVNNCWTGFDTEQTPDTVNIKQLAKIELGVQRLYALGDDDNLYTLYASTTNYDTATLQPASVCTTEQNAGQNVKLNSPKFQVKLQEFRCIIDRITQNSSMTIVPIIDNRLSAKTPSLRKDILYSSPLKVYETNLPDINTQLSNIMFTIPNVEQGWKTTTLISWTGGGSLTQFSMKLNDSTPMNPLNSQTTTI